MKHITNVLLLLAFAALGACSTMPESVSELQNARQLVESLDAQPMAEQVASDELEAAKNALARAEQAFDDGRDIDLVRHEAYLASRHAQIGQEQIAEAEARQAMERSEEQRQQIQLQARELEARRATAEARLATAEAQSYAQEADRYAAAARELAKDLQEAEKELKSLESEIENIKAEKTERGLVLTLTDVLFDTGEAELKPGAEKAIDYLADFLDENQERMLLIEGHTDSRGSDELNRELSKRRADAVMQALVAKGVNADRLKTEGHGEAYPVASNETMAGRQQNRRVEIVITNESEIDSSVRRDTSARNTSQ